MVSSKLLKGWYDRLFEFLALKEQSRGDADKTLFIKKSGKKFMVA